MRLRHLIPAAALTLATLSAHADMKFITNPCGVLTEQEISAIVGAPTKIGMKMDAAGMCMYSGPNNANVFTVRGFIFDNTHDSGENYDALARVAPPKSIEQVPGVGDKAEIITGATGDLTLYILKGTKMVSFTLAHGAPPNTSQVAHKPALTQAAKTAAGRL